jgi:hypothetical protein
VVAVQRLEKAIAGLEQAVIAAPAAGAPLVGLADAQQAWRYAVREQLLDVADALAEESAGADDGWLSAREDLLRRDRKRMLTRLSLLAPAIAQAHDVDSVRDNVSRFVRELQRHLQRMHDLLYDAVGMEVGGSE